MARERNCFSCLGNYGSKNVKRRRSLCKRHSTTALVLQLRTQMTAGLGQAKGPLKPAPGLDFPMQAVAVRKCKSPCGAMESRAANQGLKLSLFFLGWARVCHGHRVISLQEKLLWASQCSAAQGPVCPAGTGLRCINDWERCSRQGEVQDHPFPPQMRKLLGKVSTPQGNVLLCYCPRKDTNLRASNIEEEEELSHLSCKQKQNLLSILH